MFNLLFRILYTVLLTSALPLLFLRLWWKGRKNPGYRLRYSERLGIFNPSINSNGIWLHAVSVGESIAAIPLIRALQLQYPNTPMTITTTTPTGSKIVQDTFGDKISHVYFPFDLPFCWNNFFKRVKPKILIIMETELWPNCLSICSKRFIPVFIVNARLSLRSMQGYQKLSSLTREMLENVTCVMAQSTLDGERFLQLGLDSSRLEVVSNIKFDVPFEEELIEKANSMKADWGDRLVWVAASTHADEEVAVLNVFSEVLKQFPKTLLILIPRHPERFKAVEALIKVWGFSFVTRSEGMDVTPETSVLLGDTLGEVKLFYAASDMAFVGGSLVPIGGHNTIEAAALSVPVIVGPYVNNFIEVTELLIQAGGLVQVSGTNQLQEKILEWCKEPARRKQVGTAGSALVARHRGAVQKIVSRVVSDTN